MGMLDPQIRAEILELVRQRAAVGAIITVEDITKAREIVWCRHAIETIEWKRQHITVSL